MYKVTKYPHGTFSWAELVSREGENSKQFLTGLFDWSFVDVPMGESMHYTMYSLDGENVAASFQMDEESFPPEVPSHWNNYITVDDVDAIASPHRRTWRKGDGRALRRLRLRPHAGAG